MDEQHASTREQREDEHERQEEGERVEQTQRPEDLDPEDRGKDIKGGGSSYRF